MYGNVMLALIADGNVQMRKPPTGPVMTPPSVRVPLAIVGQPAAVLQEQVGHPPQRGDALGR